jgi:hypothetical protein
MNERELKNFYGQALEDLERALDMMGDLPLRGGKVRVVKVSFTVLSITSFTKTVR